MMRAGSSGDGTTSVTSNEFAETTTPSPAAEVAPTPSGQPVEAPIDPAEPQTSAVSR
jgi:hypothetical protein